MRKAAAEVYALNFKNPSLRSQCSSYLRKFFWDDDKEVAEIAGRCFWHLADDAVLETEDVLKEFVESPAFNTCSYDFLRSLTDSVARLPDIICRAAERMIQDLGSEGADASPRASLGTSTLSTLVVRLYSQTEDEQVKVRCLDLIGKMEELSCHGIHRALDAIER